MAKAQLTKNWNISPNVRVAPFVSLVATMGWFGYQNKVALLSAGWTMKFSCDGVTGPTNSSDTTDRITSDASFQVRATVDAAAQSWFVVQNADGCQLLFTYQGASDDICRISASYTGAFTLAGTTTNRPTASDELVVTAATTVIQSTAANDRVMTIGCTTESWFCYCFRQGTGNFTGFEKFDSACESGAVLPIPYVAYRYASGTNVRGQTAGRVNGGTSGTAHGAANWTGAAIRVFTGGSFRIDRIGGGNYQLPVGSGSDAASEAGSGTTIAVVTSLQLTNVPLLPIFWFGEKAASLDGLAGSPIDWWTCVAAPNAGTAPAVGDSFSAIDYSDTQATALRSNWLMSFGSALIRPWKNAAASLQTS